MRIPLAFLLALGLLAGCRGSDQHPAAVADSRMQAGSQPARVARQPVASGVRGIAGLPDRGELVAYPPDQETLRTRAYAWTPVSVSEAHALHAINGELRLRAPDGRPIRLVYDHHVEHADGNWTWVGRPPGANPGTEAIITFGEKAVFGSIPQGDGPALRLTTGRGRVWMMQVDAGAVGALPAATPDTPDTLVPPLRGRTVLATMPLRRQVAALAEPAPAAGPVLDLLIGYTSGFATRLGGQSQANTRLNFLVDVANQAYANSQLDARLRLVRTMQVSYPDATSNTTALYELTGCTETSCTQVVPALQPLHAARDIYGADVVSLVRNFNDPENEGCGVGWLIGGGQVAISSSDEYAAMSVVSDSNGRGGGSFPDNGYVCRDETLAHEVGHNLGSTHDRGAASGSDGVLQAGEFGRYPYSFGYKNTTASFFTVMAYGDAGQNQYRVFSNPQITYCGGSPCGVADQADNARSLRQTFPIVSTFRASKEAARPVLRELDVNGNGRSDLLFRSRSAGRVVLWYMSGTTRTAYNAAAVSGAFDLAGMADFNGDKRTDLLWTTTANGLVMSLSTGTGYSTVTTGYAFADGWQVAGTADVNGNGKADILLRNTSTGDLVVWFMDGTTRTAYNRHYVSPAFAFVGSGDMNRDGRQDLVWTNTQNQILVSTSNGTTFSSVLVGTSYAADYQLMGLADVNGNGTADLIFHSRSLARLVVWFMEGATRVAYSSRSTSPAYTLVGKGDFNGDRRGDLVWRDGAGHVLFSISNGSTFADSVLGYTYSGDYVLMDVP